MIIGVPKEIKSHEYRVGLLASGAKELTDAGYKVMVQSSAGTGVGISDEDYRRAGADIVLTAEDIYHKADIIVKVKELQHTECRMLKRGQIVMAFHQLFVDAERVRLITEAGATIISYEGVRDNTGKRPLLSPMSEIAGRLSVQTGAFLLEKKNGGRGTLLSGVPGVLPGRVTVIGGGVSGYNAIKTAVGMGADVTVIGRSLQRLDELDKIFKSRIKTLTSNAQNIEEAVCQSDLVIGAVLVPGEVTPKLVKEDTVRKMLKGSVIVDIGIDQGGCFETARETTHAQPTYTVHDVIHYCVANMPGAVPLTAAYTLCNSTFPCLKKLIQNGLKDLAESDPGFAESVQIYQGNVTHSGLAKTLHYDYCRLPSVF